nr:hypothetical protein [uncultured Mediterranean phage uvMED]
MEMLTMPAYQKKTKALKLEPKKLKSKGARVLKDQGVRKLKSKGVKQITKGLKRK